MDTCVSMEGAVKKNTEALLATVPSLPMTGHSARVVSVSEQPVHAKERRLEDYEDQLCKERIR